MPVAANVPPIAPTASLGEFLVSDLMSRKRGSGIEVMELRLLLEPLVDERGVGRSAVSGLEERRLSSRERKNRLAPS